MANEATCFSLTTTEMATSVAGQAGGKDVDVATTNAAGTAVIFCAVATTGSDINIPGGLTLATNDTVSITSLTYTAAV